MRKTQLGAGWTKRPSPVLRGRSAASSTMPRAATFKTMLDFQHLRERISHLTHDAWNSIVTTTDHLRTTTLNIRRRKSGEPTSTSQHQDNRPH
jgi:hypothetical protein